MSATGLDEISERWLVALLRALGSLPLPALYLAADLVFFVFYYLVRFHRRLVLENLCGAFPERSSAELRKLAAKSYRNAIHVVFESIKGLSLSERALEHHVEMENPELIARLLQEHRTVLSVAAHHANWEWLQLACASRLGVPLAALYKPLNHSAIDSVLLRLRSRFGSRLMEAKTALPELIGFARERGIIAMVADQCPRPDEDKYWSCFLGRDTAFYNGPETLALLLKAPVVFVHMQRVRRGRYRIRFELLAEPPYRQKKGEIMRRYVRAVEKQVREAPQDWIWAYKRWKYPRPIYES
jgi:KDO2-lipid IV(A) lauroyltransferase